MTYRLDPEVRKITSPVIVSFNDGREDERYEDGAALADAVFCKNYLIESIAARNGSFVLTVRTNDQINAIDWIGEEAVKMASLIDEYMDLQQAYLERKGLVDWE